MLNKTSLAAYLWHKLYKSNFYTASIETQDKWVTEINDLIKYYELNKGDNRANDQRS